jgi:hypothetical protein
MRDPIDYNTEIPKLRDYLNELAELSINILRHSRYEEYNHLIFMTSTFLCKQLSHARSVLLLVDSEQYKDALSIARVMIEGYALLLWASELPTERPLSWRGYVLIDQFKHSFGQPGYSDHQADLETMLNRYCRKFLKEDYKNKLQRDIRPDNYLNNWRRDNEKDKNKFITITIEKIFYDVGLRELHDNLYDSASGWLHWDSFSMAETIKRKADGSIICGYNPKNLGAAALASAIQALLGSASLLDKHLQLGFSDRLADFYKRIAEETKINAHHPR